MWKLITLMTLGLNCVQFLRQPYPVLILIWLLISNSALPMMRHQGTTLLPSYFLHFKYTFRCVDIFMNSRSISFIIFLLFTLLKLNYFHWYRYFEISRVGCQKLEASELIEAIPTSTSLYVCSQAKLIPALYSLWSGFFFRTFKYWWQWGYITKEVRLASCFLSSWYRYSIWKSELLILCGLLKDGYCQSSSHAKCWFASRAEMLSLWNFFQGSHDDTLLSA